MRPSFFVRLLLNAAALWVATRLVSGVEYSGGWLPFFGVACFTPTSESRFRNLGQVEPSGGFSALRCRTAWRGALVFAAD